jgi:hypothetical protein
MKMELMVVGALLALCNVASAGECADTPASRKAALAAISGMEEAKGMSLAGWGEPKVAFDAATATYRFKWLQEDPRGDSFLTYEVRVGSKDGYYDREYCMPENVRFVDKEYGC